jgi:hypothetical protein
MSGIGIWAEEKVKKKNCDFDKKNESTVVSNLSDILVTNRLLKRR